MILSCSHISKSFTEHQVLNDVSFHINEKERLAIAGPNGTGKSTLLKIILGMEDADAGQVTIRKNTKIGYLSQNQNLTGSRSLYDEMLLSAENTIALEQKIRQTEQDMKHLTGDILEEKLSEYSRLTQLFEDAGGFSWESRIKGILKGLGFDESMWNIPVSGLSGGQRTRAALGKLLTATPDLLVLDEPTNHLDMPSTAWLENFLQKYAGSIIIVSHDRYFMDKIADHVMEIELGRALLFSGNYTQFVAKKNQIKEIEEKEYKNQQAEIARQEAVITKLKQFNREKSIKRAESREKTLKKMDMVKKPEYYQSHMRLSIEPSVLSGNDVLAIEDLSKSFGGRTLFSNASFQLHRGQKVALIGANGTGKTTILKIICRQMAADGGTITLGSQVFLGYYDQTQENLNPQNTIFEELSNANPKLTNTKIRNTLAAFLFYGDDVFKKISDLSGGEKGRVSLAKLMLTNANFLILDEPTNHLDLPSKEILENVLEDYTGTLLFVSHDRYLISKIADTILELDQGNFTYFEGSYDDYLRSKAEPAPVTNTSSVSSESDGKLSWKEQKELQARQRKMENRIHRLEELIEEYETKSRKLEEKMLISENATNSEKLSALSKEKEAVDFRLEDFYNEWDDLSGKMEESK